MAGMHDLVHRMVKIQRQKQFDESEQIALGELIKLVEEEPKEDDCTVTFDFGYFYPCGLMSWRGIYAELAIGYESEPGAFTMKEWPASTCYIFRNE